MWVKKREFEDLKKSLADTKKRLLSLEKESKYPFKFEIGDKSNYFVVIERERLSCPFTQIPNTYKIFNKKTQCVETVKEDVLMSMFELYEAIEKW